MLQQAAAMMRLQLAAGQRLAPATWASVRRGFATVDASSPDTHDDFKPKVKAAGAGDDALVQIQKDITSHDVFVFMKGVPAAPQCGFSNMACKILDAYGVRYGAANVLADQGLRDGVKKFSNWPTIPQIYIKGEFVGGSDILYNMHESGELEKVLEPILVSQRGAK